MVRHWFGILLLCLGLAAPAQAADKVKVTVLSTMLADLPGHGEWGYAALVEVDGRRILFDSGLYPDTVLKNAEERGVDLSSVEEVVISHHHFDHTGGLLTLRKTLMKRNPKALSLVHVGAGAFLPRHYKDPDTPAGLSGLKADYVATGGHFVEHSGPALLAPDVWITGPVPRTYPETNYGQSVRLIRDGKEEVDTVPEDSSLVISTRDGLVVVTGCGHAGVINIVTYARKIAGERPVEALIGGIHLFAQKQPVIDWTADKLKAVGVHYFLSGHCTGLQATYQIASKLGLAPSQAAYGAVGATYELGKGINPQPIAAPVPAS